MKSNSIAMPDPITHEELLAELANAQAGRVDPVAALRFAKVYVSTRQKFGLRHSATEADLRRFVEGRTTRGLGGADIDAFLKQHLIEETA